MAYIHSDDNVIDEFIQNNIKDRSSLKTVCDELFNWFDKNVKYSRLNAPFSPLQRSDLDVISMRAGTCGDYSNLLVSVFQRLGYEAQYAYIHKDCYGDEQDHICAAVRDTNKWILIDATLPYRKWCGFNCIHQEYELLSPDAFEDKMKREEGHWVNVANQYGNELLAGLLYAPWIHEEIIKQSDSVLESVFFLLLLDERKNKTIYAYYKKYTKECGTIPVMCIISNGVQRYCFSYKTPANIWDNEQWSEEYLELDIPSRFHTDELRELKNTIPKVLLDIDRALSNL